VLTLGGNYIFIQKYTLASQDTLAGRWLNTPVLHVTSAAV